MPVIPATQEAEIRRMIVGSQPLANSLQDPLSKNPSHTVAQGVNPGFKPQYHKKGGWGDINIIFPGY
jgi:hypothetical protein